MLSTYRIPFNQQYRPEKQELIKRLIQEKTGQIPGFRLSETPVFLPYSFREKLLYAAETILHQINEISQEVMNQAIPKSKWIPNDTGNPYFLCMDFGICKSADRKPIPQLVDLQAFPSLYAFEELHRDVIFEVFPFLSELSQRMPYNQLITLMKDVIIGKEDPKNVVLMDLFPDQQKNKIDFKITENLIGIKTVCISEIIKEGRQLYYWNNEQKTPIKRIYNRVIIEELDKVKDFNPNYNIREDVDVEWVTHPNWYYKISKYLLPHLSNTYIPESYYANELPEHRNIADFVLKPIYALDDSGVVLHPTLDTIQQLEHPHEYILQERVDYADVFMDPNKEFAQGEIRMLFIWKPGDKFPTYLNNLVRMSRKGTKNCEVDELDQLWTGSSFALFVK